MKNQAPLQNLADFDNKSLLIVDDDNPFRERLARAMEKKGFEVLQAESVQKGKEMVKVKKPGFAVVDLRLNDGNGLGCKRYSIIKFTKSYPNANWLWKYSNCCSCNKRGCY